MNKGKAIGIIGVFGMAAISGLWPAYVVATVASVCIAVLDENKEEKKCEEVTITKDEK
jgi:hypothetical protein